MGLGRSYEDPDKKMLRGFCQQVASLGHVGFEHDQPPVERTGMFLVKKKEVARG